ncbi:hypothetical protein L596_012642 [Steinernema carpocapsae]|uniref:7TM GPCR serpentine receptor class x (Srx) domain-containing protein n=1 Tax=Steinernema carpocapsae TaxID=34508 RepID=A0A4U5NXT7_STECR|nr:hypothetical protein L596_012642 [Steinernema carpocapsae]
MRALFEFNGGLAADITIFVGILGLIVNVNVAIAVRKCRQFGYAFGMLCLTQTVANIGNSAVFVFLVGGITLINPDLHDTYMGRRVGQLLIFFWEAAIFSHLFISANRAIAVNFPTKYNRIFSDKSVTRSIVGVIWLISVLQALPYTFPVCSQTFDPVSFTLAYAEGWCGELTEKYGDLSVSIFIVSCISFLDLTSFIRLYQMRKSVSHESKSRAREVRLFFQACCQSGVLMFCECSFFFLSYMNEDPWYVFVSTTFIWVFTHFIDGVVVVLFSKEIRRIILNGPNAQISPSTATANPRQTSYVTNKNREESHM